MEESDRRLADNQTSLGVHEKPQVDRELVEIRSFVQHLEQRIRRLEKERTVDRPQHTKQYLEGVEASLKKMMSEHDWGWFTDPKDQYRIALGQSTYEQLLRIARELPVDRLLPIWQTYAKNTPHTENVFPDKSTKNLLKHLDE